MGKNAIIEYSDLIKSMLTENDTFQTHFSCTMSDVYLSRSMDQEPNQFVINYLNNRENQKPRLFLAFSLFQQQGKGKKRCNLDSAQLLYSSLDN